MKMKSIGAAVAGAALLMAQAQAANLLQNGSFEQLLVPGVKVGGGFAGGVVPGWDGPAASDTGVDVAGGVKAPGAQAGANAAYFHNEDGYAMQTTGTAIVAGDNYDVNFWTMNIDTYAAGWSGAGVGQISVEVYYANTGNAKNQKSSAA